LLSVSDALRIAGSTGRLQVFDFSFDLTNQYTFWSGTIAAFFLFCSYFGTDQSQVQRYLTTPDVDQARSSLLMSAYWKIPLQALVLLVGVLMFVYYLFVPSPLLFDGRYERQVREGAAGVEYEVLEDRFDEATARRADAAREMARAYDTDDPAALVNARDRFTQRDTDIRLIRDEARALVRQTTSDTTYNDVNYVFPTFVMTAMPVGLVGLLIAAIFAAAMSTIAGELAALSSASVIDFYRRFIRREASDAHFLAVSKVVTVFWGAFASIVAVWAVELGSLIEVVNRFGSFFYGSILGVFILAIGFRRATANGAFVGLFAGMGSVGLAAAFTDVAFLWHNVIGAVAVVVVGVLVSRVDPARPSSRPSDQ
jgi:Na+/proline symporter